MWIVLLLLNILSIDFHSFHTIKVVWIMALGGQEFIFTEMKNIVCIYINIKYIYTLIYIYTLYEIVQQFMTLYYMYIAISTQKSSLKWFENIIFVVIVFISIRFPGIIWIMLIWAVQSIQEQLSVSYIFNPCNLIKLAFSWTTTPFMKPILYKT